MLSCIVRSILEESHLQYNTILAILLLSTSMQHHSKANYKVISTILVPCCSVHRRIPAKENESRSKGKL